MAQRRADPAAEEDDQKAHREPSGRSCPFRRHGRPIFGRRSSIAAGHSGLGPIPFAARTLAAIRPLASILLIVPQRVAGRGSRVPTIIKAEPEPVALDLDAHRAGHHRHAARLPRAGRLRRDARQRRVAARRRGRAVQGGARRRARGRHAGDPHPRGPPPRPLRCAAGQGRARASVACASARPARWAASWSAASPATTSSRSSSRSPASR